MPNNIAINDSPKTPIENDPRIASNKLASIIAPRRYLSANRPNRGEGSAAAKVPIVPKEPNPIQLNVPKLGKRSFPTSMTMTGKIKNGISTQP